MAILFRNSLCSWCSSLFGLKVSAGLEVSGWGLGGLIVFLPARV